MVLKSRAWYKPLWQVFWSTDADEKKMLVQCARLCVLHEDLTLEFLGAEAEQIQQLDSTTMLTRRFYFLRRTLATIGEIEQAAHVLNRNKAFKQLKGSASSASPEAVRAWNDAITFFAANHEFLGNWRDDLGGHVLDRVATYAIDNLTSTIGTLEMLPNDFKMSFAYEMVAIGLTRQKETHQDAQQFISEAFDVLSQAHRHARGIIRFVGLNILLPRFKG